jgi:hypothetical protein
LVALREGVVFELLHCSGEGLHALLPPERAGAFVGGGEEYCMEAALYVGVRGGGVEAGEGDDSAHDVFLCGVEFDHLCYLAHAEIEVGGVLFASAVEGALR